MQKNHVLRMYNITRSYNAVCTYVRMNAQVCTYVHVLIESVNVVALHSYRMLQKPLPAPVPIDVGSVFPTVVTPE